MFAGPGYFVHKYGFQKNLTLNIIYSEKLNPKTQMPSHCQQKVISINLINFNCFDEVAILNAVSFSALLYIPVRTEVGLHVDYHPSKYIEIKSKNKKTTVFARGQFTATSSTCSGAQQSDRQLGTPLN